MIAQLGMYDRPSTRSANDRFWALIQRHLGYGPDQLDRTLSLAEGWLHDDLILSQTCGYPFRALLAGKVTLIGTPDYGVEGCPPGYYRSVFVARSSDPRDKLAAFNGAAFAYNEALSQSGWAAPKHHADQIGLAFGNLVRTGGHEFSARAVQQGAADFAALDAVSWALLRQDSDWARELKIIDRTQPSPGLPYICANTVDSDSVFRAVEAAITDLSWKDREILHLRGIKKIPEADYLAVPTPGPPDGLTD